jgi:hypothetical protein
VTGVKNAVTRLPSGTVVEVDGTAGSIKRAVVREGGEGTVEQDLVADLAGAHSCRDT